ncbi:MAG: N-acetyl-gamma-glutamyl-phosphate reductase [Bacillota bacterium]|nr:N-acetyl-gamma-glutamyl-phosphate reductase [Bacillota bacterium]
MIKVGIVGATGYTGLELIRILLNHPHVELTVVTSRSYQGKKLSSVFPNLLGLTDLVCTELDLNTISTSCDVVFIALPHGHADKVASAMLEAGKRVVDLGADFRLKDMEAYRQWYQEESAHEGLLQQAVYGLPELYREKLRKAKLVANPGCYPTCATLALAPLLAARIVDPTSIIIDAKSGVSGAGRSLALGSHYAEVNESFKAYKVANHRHTPEIEQVLSEVADEPIILSFTPHLVPMTRGILATSYVSLAKAEVGREQPNSEVTQAKINELYQNFYQGEQFVKLLTDQLPQTNWVAGTNNCHIAATLDKRTNRIVVVSAIDNLVKGAAGQAVQNMNIMFGLAEIAGLSLISRYLG